MGIWLNGSGRLWIACDWAWDLGCWFGAGPAVAGWSGTKDADEVGYPSGCWLPKGEPAATVEAVAIVAIVQSRME